MKPHKHAELIKAWADGAEIEYFDYATRKWFSWGDNPNWGADNIEYRIKPEPKPDVPEGLIDPKSYYQGFEDGKNSVINSESNPNIVLWASMHPKKSNIYYPFYFGGANLKLTWDEKTKKLKSAEVLK